MAEETGMNLSQDNPINIDLRNIMSEQLLEIKKLREEMTDKNNEDRIKSQGVNPYIMNPYYEENHSDMINTMKSNTSDVYANLENRNEEFKPFQTISEYANDIGLTDLAKSTDGVVNGRGISNKERELMWMNVERNVATDIIGKTKGAFSFGSEMAGDMAISGAATAAGVSLLPAVGIGIAGGFIAKNLAEKSITDYQNYLENRETIHYASDRFISDRDSERPGPGFTRRESRQSARVLNRLNNQFDISNEEMMEIFEGALSSDLLSTVSDVEDFEERMTELTDVVLRSAKSLGKTFREITNMMGQLERAGITGADAQFVLSGADSMGSLLGISSEDWVNYIANTVDSQTSGTDYDPARVLNAQASFMQSLGEEKERIETLLDSGDVSFDDLTEMEQLISNTSVQELQKILTDDLIDPNSLDSQMTKIISAAAFDEDSGRIDKEKYQQLIEDVYSGETTMSEISKETKGYDRLKWGAVSNAIEEFKAEDFATFAKGGSLAERSTVIEVAKSAGLDVASWDDFESLDQSTQDDILSNAGLALGGMTLSQMKTAVGGLDLIDPNASYVSNAINQAANLARDKDATWGAEDILSPLKSVKDFLGANQVYAPRWSLDDYYIEEALDYSDGSFEKMSETDRRRADSQFQSTARQFAYGVFDSDVAQEISGDLILGGYEKDRENFASELIWEMADEQTGKETANVLGQFVKNVGSEEDFQIFERVAEKEYKQLEDEDINDFEDMIARLMTEFEKTAEKGPKKDGAIEGAVKGIAEKVGSLDSIYEENTEAFDKLVDFLNTVVSGKEEETKKIFELINQKDYRGGGF